MTFKQFFPISVGIAILAFFLMMIAWGSGKCPNFGHLFVIWVAFQAWAMYFMAGCTIPGGVKVLLGYTGGITASIGVMELAGQLGFCGGLAGAVAVLILVVPIICFERVPWFDFIPAWFVGSGAFFGLSALRGSESTVRILKAAFGGSGTVDAALKTGVDAAAAGHLDVMGAELFSCFIGVCFGIVTVILRGKYEASLKLETPADSE